MTSIIAKQKRTQSKEGLQRIWRVLLKTFCKVHEQFENSEDFDAKRRTRNGIMSKEYSNSNKIFAFYYSNENSTLIQTLAGGVALCAFLMTWFASLGTPILGTIWVLNRQYVPISVVLVVTLISHLPWEKGYISGLVSTFARYNSMYYQKCSVVFQSKESLPGNGEEQKPLLYAFHPHGAFCMGWSILFCSKIMNEGKVRFCFSPVLYASPLFRLWCRFTGRPGSASKSSMIGYMKERKDSKKRRDHLALPPGEY